MTMLSRRTVLAAFLAIGLFGSVAIGAQAETQATDPLPSWNDGPTKQSILDFVAAVTKDGGPDYVAPAERIATFDNDGTLWIEQPIYTQFAFAIDRVKAMSNQHPEWKTQEPFASILKGDLKGLAASGEKGMVEIVAATHSGMTTTDFNKEVKEWLAIAKHPRFKVLYTDLVYQPMIELLDYLRANGFKTFIVSGGGVEFMRAFADKTYGIPPEQVIGSSGVTAISDVGREPGADQDAEGFVRRRRSWQARGHQHFIGRRPIFAFGNSDGDKEMLEWTSAGDGLRFMGIVHHTDAAREYAYDRDSSVGKLDKALDEGVAKGWTIADMKNDWKTIFPPAKSAPEACGKTWMPGTRPGMTSHCCGRQSRALLLGAVAEQGEGRRARWRCRR